MTTPARTAPPVPLDRRWRHSSHSTGSDATCVDVALRGGSVVVRDSKDPHGPVLRFTPAEWRAFLLGVRGGEFELPDGGHGAASSPSRAASSPSRAAASSSRDRSAPAATRAASARASA